MFLTVGICTWNRAHLLDSALGSFHQLRIPQNITWELLIVNNNSTDDTDDIIRRHEAHLPVRYLFEPQPGKSHALNHAVREARGDYILWTDDDALVDSNWFEAYTEAFNQWPDASIFGGPVKPWFRTDPPRWMNDETLPFVASAYAIRDLGNEPVELTYNNLPFGVNMAIRYKEQAKYLYDTKLGPRPNSELRGEETVLMTKMLDDGAKGRWVPGACVRHFIPQERRTLGFVKNYYRGYGEYQWIEIEEGTTPNRFGTVYNMLKQAVKGELRYRYYRLFREPREWVRAMVLSSHAWGRLLRRMSV